MHTTAIVCHSGGVCVAYGKALLTVQPAVSTSQSYGKMVPLRHPMVKTYPPACPAPKPHQGTSPFWSAHLMTRRVPTTVPSSRRRGGMFYHRVSYGGTILP